jgi:hypothetical protein
LRLWKLICEEDKGLNDLEKQAKLDYLWSFADILSELQDASTLINYMYGLSAVIQTGMPHGTDIQDLTGKVLKIIDKENKRVDRRGDAVRVAACIMESISELDDRLERKVMIRRFIDCKDWSSIQSEIGYSDRQTRRIYISALEHIQVKRLPEVRLGHHTEKRIRSK